MWLVFSVPLKGYAGTFASLVVLVIIQDSALQPVGPWEGILLGGVRDPLPVGTGVSRTSLNALVGVSRYG